MCNPRAFLTATIPTYTATPTQQPPCPIAKFPGRSTITGVELVGPVVLGPVIFRHC